MGTNETVFSLPVPQWAVIWLIAAAFALVALLFCALLRRYRPPVRRMREAAARLAKGDFSVRVKEPRGNSDIACLTREFNRMAQELGSIEVLRRDFMSDFSHEFKTPLAAIAGFADLIASPATPENEKAEYAAIISEQSKRLSDMAGSILLMSKLDAQNMLPDRTVYRLDEQIRECVLEYEQKWESKQLELDLRLSDVEYNGSRDMVRHIWTNLLDNAIRFTPPHGTIDISLWEDPTNVYIDIADSGSGMPPEVLKRIFDKFYQGDPSRASEGTGLGLPLARRIAVLSGGELRAESAEGRGTLMSVILPKDVNEGMTNTTERIKGDI